MVEHWSIAEQTQHNGLAKDCPLCHPENKATRNNTWGMSAYEVAQMLEREAVL
jgi:hypothetical protein